MSSLSVGQLFSVKGCVAAVTGATSGLGFMISKVGHGIFACYSITITIRKETGLSL